MGAEDKKEKRKVTIVPAVHNSVSLPVYIFDENNEPVKEGRIQYEILSKKENSLSTSHTYYRNITEKGKVDLTLNTNKDMILRISLVENDKYEAEEVITYLTKPTQEEKDKKKNHFVQVKREEKKRKEAEEKRKELLETYKNNQENLIKKNNVAIELKNVSLSFKVTHDKIDNLKEWVIRTIKRTKAKPRLFKATDNVSFKIYKGEKVGLIGFNGAGKSTILKIISGVYKPDEGDVIINGNIAPLLSLGAGFNKNYSGRENIFLNGAILGYNEEFLKSKYDEILEFSELEEFIDFPVKNYSAGMLSKLGFSIATVVNPDILILDEVLGVGDINFRKKSNERLMSLMESETTVLFVSHSINEVRKICDKAIWIEKGQIREIGEVNDICDKYQEEAKTVSSELTKKLKPKKF